MLASATTLAKATSTTGAVAGGAAVAAVTSPETVLDLPWVVIAVAAIIAGTVAIIAAANRAVKQDKPFGFRIALFEFAIGCVAGVGVWAATDFMDPDPKLQLAVMIFAGWHTRFVLDTVAPSFLRSITGQKDGDK